MRILIAEDELVSQRVLVHVLTSVGHEVVAAANGEEAWNKFRVEQFPVVITDWMMPRLDGLDLARRIRAARNKTYTWIIMLTAMDFGENFRIAMESGVDDFLTKPLDKELLRVRLTVAERVQRMGEQVRALASALPICMHCKAVRDGGDHWKRVEEYFHDIDFSHSYCPECYYEHSLVPELKRMAESGAIAAPDPGERLDENVLAALLDFEDRDSPGLFDDLVDGMHESGELLRVDLAGFGASGILAEEMRRRMHRYRVRCLDVGAGRLASQLEELTTLEPREQLEQHGPLAERAIAELNALMAALENRKASRAKGGAAAGSRG